MGFKDNREFIRDLEKTGDVVRVKQKVDWELEIGAITRRSCEINGPAALFENIKDYPGFRILGSPLATIRRFALALGLDPQTPIRDIFEEYGRRTAHLIPPVIVKDGPCKENIIKEDDIDIFRFPVPLIHDGDGGRYIGTWNIDITKELRGKWVNWGMYRIMVHDRKLLVGDFTPNKHLDMHLSPYLAQKKPMPVAIVIGADPLSTMVAGLFIEAWQDEANYAGALNQAPVELVKCETIDLYVPASAEMVIEGEVLPDVKLPEGPFGEFTGYRHGIDMHAAIRIKAITHRNNLVINITNMGIPLHEGVVIGIILSFNVMQRLKTLGLPVTGVHIPPEFAGTVIIVGVKKTQGNIVMRVKDAIMARGPNAFEKIIVVDDDVDVFNLKEVLHAFAAKCHPRRGIKVSDGEGLINLIPSLSQEERATLSGSVALFDCTWPLDLPREKVLQKISFSTYPEKVKNRVMKNWKMYGFK